MKIIHIANSDSKGGAARAAFRIHTGLKNKFINSILYVVDKISNDPKVYAFSKLEKIIYKLKIHSSAFIIRRISSSIKENTRPCSLNIFHSSLLKKIHKSNPDIVHLHWIGGEILSISDIAKIDKPIVWTLHDLWPLIGMRHILYENDIEFTGSKTDTFEDKLNKWIYKKKRKSWKMPIYFVCPSSYVALAAKETNPYGLWNFEVIGNPIDCQLWSPKPSVSLRKKFNIKEGKKIILAGAHNFLSDKNKGADLFFSSIRELHIDPNSYTLILFGVLSDSLIDIPNNIDRVILNNIENDDLLSRLYSLADVVVVPSRFETFGQVAAEAQSCGAPVVCFDNSGLTDIVKHKITGYLSEALSPKSLAEGISWVINCGFNDKLKVNSRRNICERFSSQVVSKKYSSLYQKIKKFHPVLQK